MQRVGLVEELGERIFLEQPVRQTSTVRAVRARLLVDQQALRGLHVERAVVDRGAGIGTPGLNRIV